MDFSNMVFKDHISFAGKLLVCANFRLTVFKRGADFSGAVFLGVTNFKHARFEHKFTAAEFQNSTFCDRVHFDSTFFQSVTYFDNVNFKENTSFNHAIFGKEKFGSGIFKNTIFEKEANFIKADFRYNSTFENAEFKDKTNFREVHFHKKVLFNNSKFNNTITFRGAEFGSPPKFFETGVHEDLNLNGIDWRKAEHSYNPRHFRGEYLDTIEESAEEAIAAWERLERIMNQLEKHEQRHVFFRLMKRAERQRDGWTITTMANWIYDILSSLGWGIGRSLIWWFGQYLFFSFVLAVTACIQANKYVVGWIWEITLNSFLVSFSNSLSFLRLGSPGGHLEDNFEALKMATEQMGGVFSTVGTIQAVLGPILLFLVLLTLRNRFRIG
ncbi:MAG: hypothetical protein OXH90_02860 [Paracoccaceae bacterium]|nr:hypothetical protein [Paracoccaceae bacterium]MDE2916526.1 hypothetical protein [Paracoccaceae bacterium]